MSDRNTWENAHVLRGQEWGGVGVVKLMHKGGWLHMGLEQHGKCSGCRFTCVARTALPC